MLQKECSFYLGRVLLIGERQMPKVTEAHIESRRTQILDAAMACFARQGFHQTTMQDICREAALSPGAVYGHFAGKEEIIHECCALCQQIELSGLEEIDLTAGPVGVLDALVEHAFAGMDGPKSVEMLRMNVQLWSEAMRSPELKASLYANGLDLWKSFLADLADGAQRSGKMDPGLDPESVARVLLATWQGLVLQKALDPAVDVPSYVETLKAMYAGNLWRGTKE
jgi:AcrR family transcriptional regulator